MEFRTKMAIIMQIDSIVIKINKVFFFIFIEFHNINNIWIITNTEKVLHIFITFELGINTTKNQMLYNSNP